MKEQWIASVDRITEQTAYLVHHDGERMVQMPLWALPQGAEEGMAFTVTVERNLEEEEVLRREIEELRRELNQ